VWVPLAPLWGPALLPEDVVTRQDSLSSVQHYVQQFFSLGSVWNQVTVWNLLQMRSATAFSVIGAVESETPVEVALGRSAGCGIESAVRQEAAALSWTRRPHCPDPTVRTDYLAAGSRTAPCIRHRARCHHDLPRAGAGHSPWRAAMHTEPASITYACKMLFSWLRSQRSLGPELIICQTWIFNSYAWFEVIRAVAKRTVCNVNECLLITL
jgi:hypothetical protein